jgi:hypothetical protein
MMIVMKSVAKKAKKPLGREFAWASETKLRSYRKYSKDMKSLIYLSVLPADPREKLLIDLYRLAKRKIWVEEWANAERVEAPEFRAWRKFLKTSRLRLLRALLELTKLAPELPHPSEVELFFDADKFLSGIGKIITRLTDSIVLAQELETILAALVNPTLRNSTERRVVKEELYARLTFSPRSKGRNIDHWLIRSVAATLDKYQDVEGKKIRRYDRVISKYFEAAFGYSITDENVRAALRRVRSKAPLSGVPAWDKF